MEADLFSEVLVRSHRRGVQIFLTGSSAILQVLTSMSVTHSVSNAASKHAPGMLFPANQRSIKRVIMLNFSVERRIDCQLGCCIGTCVRSLPISRISWYMLVCVGMYIWRSGSKQILVPKAGGQVPFGKTQSIDPRRQIRQTEPGFATDGHGASRLKPSHGKSNVTKYIKISTSKCFSVIMMIMIIMIIIYHYCVIFSIIS